MPLLDTGIEPKKPTKQAEQKPVFEEPVIKPHAPQPTEEAQTRQDMNVFSGIGVESYGVGPTPMPDANLTQINANLGLLLEIKQKIEGLSLASVPLTPPSMAPVSTQALDKMQSDPLQQMSQPSYPDHVQSSIIANSIQATLADIMVGIVGGITGEAITTPLPSAGILQQSASFALDELAKFEDLSQKIEFTNMELEREQRRDIVNQLANLDSRLDQREQQAFTNYMNLAMAEMSQNLNLFNAESTAVKMNMDLQNVMIESELKKESMRYNTELNKSQAEIRRKEFNATAAARTAEVNASYAFNKAQALVSMMASQRQNRLQAQNPAKTAEEIATVATALNSPQIMTMAQKGFDQTYNLGVDANVEHIANVVSGSYVTKAKAIYEKVLAEKGNTQEGREIARKAESLFMQLAFGLTATGEILESRELDGVTEIIVKDAKNDNLRPYAEMGIYQKDGAEVIATSFPKRFSEMLITKKIPDTRISNVIVYQMTRNYKTRIEELTKTMQKEETVNIAGE